MSALYEAIGEHQDASKEQVAWLSSMERKMDHWKMLGYFEYEDYLAAIDPHEKARKMIASHKDTARRKSNAIDTVHECWSGSPELLELVAANEGLGKWMGLASLAKATDRAPEVAKYCLNLAILARIQCKKSGRGATSFFTGPDFIEAKKMATTIDWATRPWDKEYYEQVSDYPLKMYRGLVLPKTKYPGKEDRRRTCQIDPLETQDATVAAASASGRSSTQSQSLSQLASEDTAATSASADGLSATQRLAAILDTSSGSALSRAISVSSSSVSPSERGRPSSKRHTPRCEVAPAPCPAAPAPCPAPTPAPAPCPPPTPAPAPRRRISAVDPETDNEEEDGRPPLATVVSRTQRKEQAAFRAKFGISDPELPPTAGAISLRGALEEVTGGRKKEWYQKKEIHLPGCLDWLLKDDKEVVEMLSHERRLINHHHCDDSEPWESPMSLAHQAARQDPGMYLIALSCLKTTSVVSVPFQNEGSLFVELDLDDPAGSTRVARRPSTPSGRRLSLAWAGVSEDGAHIEGSTKSWGKYVVGHARAGLGNAASIVRVRSASVLGSAMLCQGSFLSPAVGHAITIVAGEDRALARDFIQRTRGEILRQLKIAFRELIMAGQFIHQGVSYYANLGATQASDDSNTANDEAPKQKRQ